MTSNAFTRDEVILALDVLYSKGNERVKSDSSEMIELSALLNRLPIHPIQNRRYDFRTPSGIATQLLRFQKSIVTGVKHKNVGPLFYTINSEFYKQLEELHSIATAIRKNEPYFDSLFGEDEEDEGFPEGILLGHLHKKIEHRDGIRVKLADHCEICDIKPEYVYRSNVAILQPHLLVPPTSMNGGENYSSNQFITVCPNCHSALHRMRPWVSRGRCGEILL